MALKRKDRTQIKGEFIMVPVTKADKEKFLELAQAKGITTARLIRGIVLNRQEELIAA
jgi:hypothetical protein